MQWSGVDTRSKAGLGNGECKWNFDLAHRLTQRHKARVLFKSLLYDYKREAWITSIGDMQAQAVVGAGGGGGGEELLAK